MPMAFSTRLLTLAFFSFSIPPFIRCQREPKGKPCNISVFDFGLFSAKIDACALRGLVEDGPRHVEQASFPEAPISPR